MRSVARKRGLSQQNQSLAARVLYGLGMIVCCTGSAAVGTTDVVASSTGQMPSYVMRSENSVDSRLVSVPFLPASGNQFGRDGFVRVINHADRTGEVRIDPFDDEGMAYGPLTLAIGANTTVNFNTRDLEAGNAAKGLTGSTGLGQGDWRLDFASTLDIEVLSYIRTPDGFLTAMHDVLPFMEGRHQAQIFNPGENANQVSLLRVVNPEAEVATVFVEGVDDRGRSPGPGVTISVAPGASRSFTAAELESGSAPGHSGSLGDGVGKWRLTVQSDTDVSAMGLLSSPTGHLTNLSTKPRREGGNVHEVPLFPASSDQMGRQGFVRLVNTGEVEATIRVVASDDTDRTFETLGLTVGANEVAHFNSSDLETGNSAKGLVGSTGAGEGDWRLAITSDADIEVLSYVRTPDGFLTAMHDLAPNSGPRHRIPTFNPGSNTEKQSLLRVVNSGSREAIVTLKGVDDTGKSSTGSIVMRIPPGTARTLHASELESGGDGFDGALGDGAGKWQLTVTSDRPVGVMSLLSNATGHLTNLSTAPSRGAGPPESAQEAFVTPVSTMVQEKCVSCHVEGGEAQDTRLVFFDQTVEGHIAANQAAFERFLSRTDDGAATVLDKIRGVNHEGGVQVPEETEEYAAVRRFLDLLVAEVRDRVPTDGELVVGGSATGDIEEPGDEDWFAVDLAADTAYRVDVEGAATQAGTLKDPDLVGVYGPGGRYISGVAIDDDGGEGRNAVGFLTAESDGTHYVAVAGSGDLTGTYEVSVGIDERRLPLDDCAADSTSACVVDVGAQADGKIEHSGDEDWFGMDLEAGASYRVDLAGSSSGGGTLEDPGLGCCIFRADGGFVDGLNVSNDGGEGRDAVGVFTPERSGKFFVVVRGGRSGTGTYTLSVAAYEDDFPDNAASQGVVELDDSVTGEIEEPGDEDWFGMEMESGTSYRLDLAGSSSGGGTLEDPGLGCCVFAADGGFVDGLNVTNDGGEGRDAVGVFTPERSGKHFVVVRGGRSGTGTYTLSVAAYEDDFPDNATSQGVVELDDSVTGEIEEPGDEDWFGMEMESGTSYRLDLAGSSSGGGTLEDPGLGCCVFAADGGFVDGLNVSNDGGEGQDAVGVVTATEDGEYFVSVRGYGGGKGSYTLSLRTYADDYADNQSSQGTVELDGTVTGEIEEPGDQDWLGMELEAGTSYRLDLAGSSSGGGTLEDPEFGCCVFSAGGGFVEGLNVTNDGGEGRDAVGVFTPERSGKYFVVARGDGDGTGNYTLSLAEYEDDRGDDP